MSYGLFRSAESYFRTVVCCTGSFSAYRSEILKSVADEKWVNQKFLGKVRTYGDDRSLTRLVLAKGYDTVYFMDDSIKNIKAVDDMLKRYPNVKSITKLIREIK